MKHPFIYSLITKDGDLHTGKIDAKSMSRAKRILSIQFPRCESIAVKVAERHHYYHNHASVMTL